MKKFKVLSAVFLVLTLGFLAVQCQHDDENVIPVNGPDPIVRGTEKITCTNCNTDTNVSGSWYMDKAHSNVMWETQYKVFGSKLTGRFNSFFMDNLTFDEANPATFAFVGRAQLSTVNTSEPARDGGCLQTTFKSTTNDFATLTSKPGTGRYSSTDAGFLVDADFTFVGITKTVTVKILFAPK